MALFDWYRWRITRRRVDMAARVALEQHGDVAFVRFFEMADQAEARGRHGEARFCRAVGREIARCLRRRAIVHAILAPSRGAQLRRRAHRLRVGAPRQSAMSETRHSAY